MPAVLAWPGTWNTADGWISFRALWAWHAMIPAAMSMGQIYQARATQMGFGGEGAADLARDAKKELLPA